MQSQSPNKNAQGVGGIINPPPGLAPPIINNNIDDDEYEEEMVSLGLSRDSGSFLASINSKDELDESISSNTTANNLNPPPGISLQPPVVNNNNMVGMNRKSAFPATPAAGVANNNSRIQRVGNNAGAPIVRRTPGPMSAAHQARHRRTPGPPGKHQQYTDADHNRMHARTPVMSGSRMGKTPHKSAQMGASSLVTPSNKTSLQLRAEKQQAERQLYTPAHFTLAKNADLHMNSRPDAFSPATIRMTNSLEAILTDDDDYVEAKQRAIEQMQKKAMTPNRKFVPSNNDAHSDTGSQGTYPSSSSMGAFRRIQSTADNSDDEEMDEMKDLDVSSLGELDSLSHEEAEISMINDDEDDDADPSAPKPLSFAPEASSVVSGSSGGAFKPAKRVVPTTAPKPQRTIPRHAGSRNYQAGGGPGQGGQPYSNQQQQWQNQHQQSWGQQQQQQQGQNQYYPQQQQQQQYNQPSPQYAPPPHPYSQPPNFHLPSIMDSPLNQVQHPNGMVSPLNLPTYHPPNMGGPPAYPQQQMHNNNNMQGGGNGGDWRGGHSPGGYAQTGMLHPNDLQHGMGMPGHASPDFSYEMSRASPFTLPPHHPPYPDTGAHYPQQMPYHPPSPGAMHHGQAPYERPMTKPRENPRGYNNRRSPSPATFSPSRYQPSPSRGKDSVKSVSSPTSSSSAAASLLRQTLPGGLNTSASSSDVVDHNDWFVNPSSQKSTNLSYSTIDSAGSGPSKHQHPSSSLASASRDRQHQTGGAKPSMPSYSPSLHNYLNAKGPSSAPYGGGGIVPNNSAKQKPDEFVLESPTERQAFKEFGKQFRQKENESGLSAARDFALACLSTSNRNMFLPEAVHWRVYLELADVAKRSNLIEEARKNYRMACDLQPRASQGWLEHSKLEEESGNLRQCAKILQEGLEHCGTNENLLIRTVKFYERVGTLDKARQLLSKLKHMSVDKAWKTMLEGALLEARVGRYPMAREVLKFLTHNVPWYGPLYLAHTKLENDYGSPDEAFSIVEKGLKELPRYGPLYFQAFKQLEKEDLQEKAYTLPRTMKMVARADSISRELLWKVHLEAAQMQERAAVLAVEANPKKLNIRVALQATRRSYAKAIMLCPANLSWKIWLAAGRTEVSCGNTKGARELFLRAHESVSEKGRSTVFLECARLEEYCGDLTLSRSLLCKARNQFGKSDWKVWLSSVNLECRCNNRLRAIKFAQEALNLHRGTGRLWAALIQLRHENGEHFQMKVLKCALRAVPKSGEVWCEGARIYLNPFSSTFDLRASSRHLAFAARFTPQYGDSFLEQLRLNMIDQWFIPLAIPFITSMYDEFLSCNPMDMKDAHRFIAKHTKKAAEVMKTQLEEEREDLITKDVLDTSELELRCSSADPNYGHLWFKYRGSCIDTAREVIRAAKVAMADSVIDHSYLYIAAVVRRCGVLMLIEHMSEKIITPPSSASGKKSLKQQEGGVPSPSTKRWDIVVEKQLRLAPSLDKMISVSPDGSKMFTGTLGEGMGKWDKLSLLEKRKILFGSDSLLS